MKKMCVMFILVMMGNVAKSSQAPENPRSSQASSENPKDYSVDNQRDAFSVTNSEQNDLANGDIRIEYSDGSYDTIVAWKKDEAAKK